MSPDAIAVVEAAYAAPDEDDIPAFLAFFDSDGEVQYPGGGLLPYGGSWLGIDAIARFLDMHDETEEIQVFERRAIVASESSVYVRGLFQGRSKITGVVWETDWIHLFDIGDGHIRRWQAFFDSAAAVWAHATPLEDR
jgi:uncharacterized protein